MKRSCKYRLARVRILTLNSWDDWCCCPRMFQFNKSLAFILLFFQLWIFGMHRPDYWLWRNFCLNSKLFWKGKHLVSWPKVFVMWVFWCSVILSANNCFFRKLSNMNWLAKSLFISMTTKQPNYKDFFRF